VVLPHVLQRLIGGREGLQVGEEGGGVLRVGVVPEVSWQMHWHGHKRSELGMKEMVGREVGRE
jgi:hypothetical protein